MHRPTRVASAFAVLCRSTPAQIAIWLPPSGFYTGPRRPATSCLGLVRPAPANIGLLLRSVQRKGQLSYCEMWSDSDSQIPACTDRETCSLHVWRLNSDTNGFPYERRGDPTLGRRPPSRCRDTPSRALAADRLCGQSAGALCSLKPAPPPRRRAA